MKKLLVALALLTCFAASDAQALTASEIKRYVTKALMDADTTRKEGVMAYCIDTNTTYVREGALSGVPGAGTWRPLDPRSIEWAMSFDEGASKGLALQALTQAAYSTTADAYNVITYGSPPVRFTFTTNTTATGTITPAATAVGIDLTGGSPGDNDEWTATWGQIVGTGGPLIPGTTPAWEACVTLKIEDVSGTDGCWLAVTSTGAHADLSSGDPNYTSYAAIGAVSGAIYVSDHTTGGTDTTNTWADAAQKEICILGTAASVITYTIDGVAPSATDAHTLGDGVPHVMRVQCLNAGDIANKVELSAGHFALQ